LAHCIINLVKNFNSLKIFIILNRICNFEFCPDICNMSVFVTQNWYNRFGNNIFLIDSYSCINGTSTLKKFMEILYYAKILVAYFYSDLPKASFYVAPLFISHISLSRYRNVCGQNYFCQWVPLPLHEL